jgi:hypothetical protein
MIVLNIEVLINLSLITGLLSLVIFDLKTPCYSNRSFREFTKIFLLGAFSYPYWVSLIALKLLYIFWDIVIIFTLAIYSILEILYYFSTGNLDKLFATTFKDIDITTSNMAEYILLTNQK